MLEVWSDQEIRAGTHLDKAIISSLETADLVILLISPDFVASDYCYTVELSTAIARHEAQQAIVVPIIVRPTDWESLPFSRLKALPGDGVPITTWDNEDSAWLNVAKAIRQLVSDQGKRLNSRKSKPPREARAFLKEEFSRLHARYESGPNLPRGVLGTGISALDECLDGLHGGDLVVVASRPGLGHSDLVLGFALQATLKHRRSALYISPRDSGSRVMRRATSALGRVPWSAISTGDISEEEWPRITSAITLLSDVKLLIDDSADLDAKDMLGRVKDACQDENCGLVVIEGVDYFVGISSSSKTEIEASRVARSLRAIAREYGTTVVVSLGIGPRLEARYDKRPLLADLGAWHCMEQEADQVLFIHQDAYYQSGTLEKGPAEIIVGKNVHGPVGMVSVFAEPEYGRFESAEQSASNVEKLTDE